MSKTKIEWSEFSWNPFRGCRHKSDGCKFCYAELIASRFSGTDKNGKVLPFSNVASKVNGEPRWNGKTELDEQMLLEPLKRKKPTTYFVNSMSDTFYEEMPDEWIDKLFAVMALSSNHTFQILTKRAERMKKYLSKDFLSLEVWLASNEISSPFDDNYVLKTLRKTKGRGLFPLPNVWIGVSVENQQTADERIPHLLNTPAAVRFLSCEPLLDKVDLTKCRDSNGSEFNYLENEHIGSNLTCFIRNKIDWVIVGGESGNNARPTNPDWVKSLRDQCYKSDTAFFFKQWGEWFPVCEQPADGANWAIGKDKALTHIHRWKDETENVSFKVGKKNAGRFLDGREWNEFPKGE